MCIYVGVCIPSKFVLYTLFRYPAENSQSATHYNGLMFCEMKSYNFSSFIPYFCMIA